MAATIDIVNQALFMAGSKPINGLDDKSYRANLAKNMLPISRQSCLRDIPWKFARRYRRLTPTGDSFYISDFSYVSRLPHDTIRAIQVYLPFEYFSRQIEFSGSQQPLMSRWKVVGNYVGLISEEADLVYTYDAPADEFDSLAAEYLSGMMAMKMAIPLRSSSEIRADLVTNMRSMRKEAASANGLEGLHDKFVAPMRLTAVRRARSGVTGVQ